MPGTYVGPVRRIKSGKGHRYEDANKRRVPGVTTMVKGVPSPQLTAWKVRVTADYMLDHWDELQELPPSERHTKLTKAHFNVSDPAANRGREVHDIATHLLRGEEVDVPDDIAGHVESLIACIDAYSMQVVFSEAVIFSHRHGYAGTTDGVADFPLGLPEPHPFVSGILPAPALRLLFDWKTARSGIYGETCLQCAGYRHADTFINPETGEEEPMIPVDGAVGIHITADDFDVIPLDTGEDMLRMLLYAGQVHEFQEHSRDFVGEPIRHPSRVQRRRLEVVQGIEVAS